MNTGSPNLDALLLKYTSKGKERELLEAFAGAPVKGVPAGHGQPGRGAAQATASPAAAARLSAKAAAPTAPCPTPTRAAQICMRC